MDEQLVQIGKRIRKARKEKGLSQLELAEATGLSVPFISNVENGKQTMNIKALISISDALGVSADWILRNNTSQALNITADEISAELAGCSSREREIILKFVQDIKSSIRQLNTEGKDD